MPRVPLQITMGSTARAKHGIHDLPPSVKVHNPGDPGYHGPRTRLFATEAGQRDLEDATRHANRRESMRDIANERLRSQRNAGRILLGTTAAVAAAPAALIPVGRRNFRRSTEANQKRTAALQATGAVRKGAFHAADPGIRHVKNIKGVHDISGMPDKPTFSNKVHDLVVRYPNTSSAVLSASPALGIGALAAGTTSPRRKFKQSQRDLRSAQAKARQRLVATHRNQNKRVTKGWNSLSEPKKLAAVGIGAGALFGASEIPAVKRKRREGKAAGLMYRASPEYRGLPRSERARLAGRAVDAADSGVSKTLYAREQRLSPLRVLELGAGAGLAAWGLGRSPVVGHALARGLRLAAGKNNQDAMTALRYAMAAQGALRRGTAPAERSLRQVRRINEAINKVPSAVRPELAATAGLLLAGHAGPVNTTSYRPVSMPVRPPAYGW
jgi:hypothetical protein